MKVEDIVRVAYNKKSIKYSVARNEELQVSLEG